MKTLLRRTFEFLELQLRLRNPRLAWKIFRARGSARDFCRSNGHVVVRDVGLIVDAESAPLLAKAGLQMRHSTLGAGVTWRIFPGPKLEAQVQDLCFEISSFGDAFVISEIFAFGVYAMTRPGPVVVIDVGANIGISSVYFASRPWVRRVFAFEPLKPTAEVARANIRRNSQYQDKITLFEYGLGSKDETVEVQFSPEWKGQTGKRPLPEHVTQVSPSWMEKITVRNASASLLSVLESAAGCAVVLKMDCEGAEWEIIPEMAQSGVLKRIDQIVLEWHFKTPEVLEQLLSENGFSVLRRVDAINAEVGLIYATRIEPRTTPA